MRQALWSTVLVVLVLASPAWAQEEGVEDFPPPLPPEGEEGGEEYPPPLPPDEGSGESEEAMPPPPTAPATRVKVAVFIFPELEMDASVATEVTAGIRRGIRADRRLEWVDPSSVIEPPEDEESTAARGAEKLAQAIEYAHQGRWRNVVADLDDAIEDFESDLGNARRRDLVDATMLWGAAQCQMRRTRVCESAFRRVVTFRENVSYDEDLLPPGPESVFEQVRDETLEGPRGSLRIETEPPGAEVFVDGRFVGAAPTRAEGLLAGDHYVTLKMVGYERQVQRVTVQTEFEDTATFEMQQLDNYLALQHALEPAREEMGQPRAGDGIRGLRGTLYADQVVLGDLSRIGDSDEFNLILYLYDLRTSHGLRRIERQLQWDVPNLAAVEEITAELYRDVDLTGRIRPVEEQLPLPPREPDPFYRTWWFWSIVGAVIVGTTIGVVSAVRPEQEPVIRIPF